MDNLDKIWAGIESAGAFALDFEASGLDTRNASIIGVALAWGAESAYIPILHRDVSDIRAAMLGESGNFPLVGGQASWADVRENLQRLCASRKVVMHNAMYDLTLAYHNGLYILTWEDTMILASVVDAGSSHALKGLAKRYLGLEMTSYESLTLFKGPRNRKMYTPLAWLPIDKVGKYAAEDASATLALWHLFHGKLSVQPTIKQLYEELEMPVRRVCCDMHRRGVPVDVESAKAAAVHCDKLVDQALDRAAYVVAPRAWKRDWLGSDMAVSQMLYGPLDGSAQGLLNPLEWGAIPTKRWWSVASAHLEDLANADAISYAPQQFAKAALAYRQVRKLNSTFVQTYATSDGSLHPTWDQRGASTGRFSCYGPNLQNQPVGESYGVNVRSFVKAPVGWKLVAIDYSQIELRVMAHLSQCPYLIGAYRDGADLHALTASRVFGVPIESVTKAQRSIGKTANFAQVYGSSIGGLAFQTGLDWKGAERVYNALESVAPEIRRFGTLQQELVKRRGYTETILGRRRLVGNWEHYATCINSPIQGSAADIIKLAMLAVSHDWRIDGSHCKLIMTVHDELVFLVAEDYVDEVIPLLVGDMETAIDMLVPIHVDVKVGDDWGSCQNWPFEHVPWVLNPELLEEKLEELV